MQNKNYPFYNCIVLALDVLNGFLAGLRHFLIGFTTVVIFELKLLTNIQSRSAYYSEKLSRTIWIALICQSLLFVIVSLTYDYLLIPLNIKVHETIIGNCNLIDKYQLLINVIYTVCWSVPAFILSKIYGGKIALLMFKRTQQEISANVAEAKGQQKLNDKRIIPIQKKFEQMFTLSGTYVLIIVIKLITADYLICRGIVNACLSLLYAFYAFDFSWTLNGEDLKNRCTKLAQYWPYFTGFGITFVVVLGKASAISFLTSTAVYVVIYPLLVMVATRIQNEKMYIKYKAPFGFWILHPANYIINVLINNWNLFYKWFVQKYEPVSI
ncbi:hypothetical protein GJ496_007384 [Pomphorhynchus laevis]|nr:hypothetical protein GJ496_007384 [Pomphorhynchus laevis]